jgi:hypothetical protein
VRPVRLASALAIGASLLWAATAQAAAPSLVATKLCYQEREPVVFGGGPFTPGGLVDVRRDALYVGALTAEKDGAVVGTINAPVVDPAKVRPFSLVARDRANPSLLAQLNPLATVFEVAVRPTTGRPNRIRRITARGFTTGTTLYVHVRRGRRGRNLRVGGLKPPCGDLSVRKRIFRRNARRGTYKIQFDTAPTYSARRVPRVVFMVTVLRRFRGASAALNPFAGGSLIERWGAAQTSTSG